MWNTVIVFVEFTIRIASSAFLGAGSVGRKKCSATCNTCGWTGVLEGVDANIEAALWAAAERMPPLVTNERYKRMVHPAVMSMEYELDAYLYHSRQMVGIRLRIGLAQTG